VSKERVSGARSVRASSPLNTTLVCRGRRRGVGAGRSTRALAALFIGSGVNHFLTPRPYRQIVPPSLQSHAKVIVEASGAAEIIGGLAVLVPFTRRAAGPGLILLLAAVFPANVYMARAPERFARIPRWALYGRLPLQPLMMWWAWRATRR
jgi:uncharacterized membrane protein